MDKHLQVEHTNDGYQAQMMYLFDDASRKFFDVGKARSTYAEALAFAAKWATAKCPLLAWGYIIDGPDSGNIGRAVRLQAEYEAALAVGHRYQATGDVRVFA